MKFFKPKVFISIVAFFCTFAVSGEKRIVLANDTILSADMEIPYGTTLIIDAGVRIQFEGYRTVLIKGLIIAEGTESEPILFTAVDRASGSREKPAWKGFEIIGKESQCLFRHCRFEGAYRNLVWDSNPSFDSCEFTGNHYAVYCTRNAVPHIQNCRFTRNTYGIAADFASPLLVGNFISENNIGLYLQLSSKALANKNIITGNGTDIRSEDAFGSNRNSFSMQHLWDLMRQLF